MRRKNKNIAVYRGGFWGCVAAEWRPVRDMFARLQASGLESGGPGLAGSDGAAALELSPDAAADAAINAAIADAWSKEAAARWLSLYGSELAGLDGLARVGGLSCFGCPGQNYISFTDAETKETAAGAPDQAAAILAALFGRLGRIPEAPDSRRAPVVEDMPADDMPADDMPEAAADIPDGWASDFYRDQTRAAWASGLDLDEPQNLSEVVASSFRGKKYFLDRQDFAAETGYGSELNKFNLFWAKSGGLSLVAWAELIAANNADTGYIPRTADGAGYDIQAIRDAIIDLFAVCSRPAEIYNYTREENRRRLENLNGLF